MTLDLDRDDRAKPSPARLRRLVPIALTVALGLTVSASLSPARSQDPADPQAPAKAAASQPKAKAAKAAEPKAETPEAAPDTPKAVEVPPPPGFSRVPRTPAELWEVIDYMTRAGQATQSVPYIKQFLAIEPDDAAMLALRDQFGEGSFLSLADLDATRPYAKPVVDRLNGAIVRHANDPARLALHASALAKSPAERNYALKELRTAGSNAVPVILKAYREANESDRRPIAEALGGLDRGASAALIAVLDSGDAAEVSAAAAALARIGDVRAIPALTWVAARSNGPGKAAAGAAVARLTGLPFESQPKSPTYVLADEARAAHLRTLPIGELATVWVWDADAKLPVAKSLPKAEGLGLIGIKDAKEALALDPANEEAQATLIALTLDRAKPGQIPPSVLASGPTVLSRVTRQAIADRRPDLAVKAIGALAKVTDRNALTSTTKPHALVEALSAPDRRVQFAAAEAVVGLDPKSAFPGSSKLVPVLARFVSNPRRHGAIVIDGNAARGSQVAGFLQPLGYDTQFTMTGESGFRLASDTANIEMVVINPFYLGGAWTMHDTIANLRADARTADLPIFLVGPLNLEDQFANRVAGFSGIYYLVTPTESTILKGEVDRALAKHGSTHLSEAERSSFALKASQLLTKISVGKGSPFAADLAAVEPNLILALQHSETAEGAAAALGDVPGVEAQRGLANSLLDPSMSAASRLKAAESLARSLRKFGPLLLPEQEQRLVKSLDAEADPALRTALATVVGALKPKPAAVGRRLSADASPTTTK